MKKTEVFAMKFSCEKALLQSAILIASRAVAAKSSIPALEGLLLEAGDSGTVYLTGYNQETGIRSSLQAQVTEPGSLVLPARLFSEIVRKMDDDLLTLQEAPLVDEDRFIGFPADFLHLGEGDTGHHKLEGAVVFHDGFPPQRQSEPVHSDQSEVILPHGKETAGVDGAAFILADGEDRLADHETQGLLRQLEGVLVLYCG